MIFVHPASPRAQQIGRVQIKRLFVDCECGGSNPDDLVGRYVMIRTKIEKYMDRNGNDAESARVIDFFKATGRPDPINDDLPF